MQTDADIQVWLNNTAQAQTQVIVPYVSSSSAQDLRYRIRAVQEKDGNRAVIGQTGVIHIAADTPAAIYPVHMYDPSQQARRYLRFAPRRKAVQAEIGRAHV